MTDQFKPLQVPELRYVDAAEVAGNTASEQQPVLRVTIMNGRICGASPRQGMRALANGSYDLFLKEKK